jgi:2-desacetyl-2-hydroxyethyl bacteriochlorophyllide A dehydrogenase
MTGRLASVVRRVGGHFGSSPDSGSMERRVRFPRPGSVEIEEFTADPPEPGRVAIRTHYSLISTGTELTVFESAFEAGTHWEDYARFPFRPGYSAVGVVVARGDGVLGLNVGDRVAFRAPHASYHVTSPAKCTRVPDGIDLADAVWFALAKIAYVGAQAARHAACDSVVVIGAGPVGQMSIRWASASGAKAVVAVARSARRLELARRGGATDVAQVDVTTAREAVTEKLGGVQPDVVIDTTGNPDVLPAALRLVRDRGRVVVLGDTGMPSKQHLTSDLIVRGVEIVGAHDSHAPTGDAESVINELFFDLVVKGTFSLDGLNTHTLLPTDCVTAYQLARDRRAETIGIVFDWRANSDGR